MATQGLISITKNNSTYIKIVCGCNGFNAEAVAKIIKDNKPENIEDIYDIAITNGLGCMDCLVVMDKDNILYRGDDDVPLLYRETFYDPKFNPRWISGITGNTIVFEAE